MYFPSLDSHKKVFLIEASVLLVAWSFYKYAKRLKGFYFISLLILTVFSSCSDSTDQRYVDASLRNEALDTLRSVLHSDLKWQSVHAAEFLVDLDYSEVVDTVFRKRANMYHDSLRYRHGIWRVLAQSSSPREKSDWVARIEKVFNDPQSEDRTHAVESLAKLGVAPDHHAQLDDSVLHAFYTWARVHSSEEERVRVKNQFISYLNSSDYSNREKGIAAYALRFIGGLSVEHWNKVVNALTTSNLDSGLRLSLLTLGLVEAPPDVISSRQYVALQEEMEKLVNGGNLKAKLHLATVLAETGDEADLSTLREFLRLKDPSERALVADINATSANAILRIERRYQPSLSGIDWIVIAIYGALMLGIGWFYSRRNKTEEDYQLGGRKMNSTSVGISLFATLLSTVSYLSYPGEMIKYGPVIFAGMLGFPLVYFVAGWWLIPQIMKMKVTSAYEILEIRLGTSIRMLAIFMFLSLRFLWMATIVYVTVDIAFLSVVSINPDYIPFLSILLIIITIIYTSMGGLKAVVMTDVIQTIVFLGGALISILIVSYHAGSFAALIPGEWSPVWKPFRLGFDPQERTTVGNAVMMLFAWYICTTGSDQLAIQRYLSTRDITSARKSLKVSLYSNLIAKLLLALLGLAMLTFFSMHPHFLADGQNLGEQADTLFPRFILIGLPIGLSGLVIAGLLAAAMSSLSSGLNSVSTVISEDIIKRFKILKEGSQSGLKRVQILSYLTGFIVMILSFMVANVQGTLFDVLIKVTHLFVAPLFVLFFMALFISFSRPLATFIGGLISIATAISIAFFGAFGITVFWVLPCSFFIGSGIAVLLSLIEHKIKN